MKFNPQQDNAIKKVDRWFKTETKTKQIFRVFGYAGTGKTTIAKYFADSVEGNVLFAAYTGKASHVLTKKGSPASTIHSLIYRVEKKNGVEQFVLNRNSIAKYAKLIVIDECSMVNEEIAKDLMSFKKPILVLGDPAQLPPVKGAGYFTNAKPDVMLTEIHRQAKDNPIIQLATMVREEKTLPLGTYGESCVVDTLKIQDALDVDQVLTGRIATKNSFNARMRKRMGYTGLYPEIDEKLICLKNNSDKGILNGQIFHVKGVVPVSQSKSRFLRATVMEEDGNGPKINVQIPKGYFDPAKDITEYDHKKGDQFEWGYAITCHKSQGSQWDNVLVYDESFCFREHSYRWLYTAITRAAEKVQIVRG